MYLIPLVRTSRAIVSCILLPENPLLAITASEIVSYTIPFINNSPINAGNNMLRSLEERGYDMREAKKYLGYLVKHNIM